MAKLVVLTQAFAGKSIELKAERTTIGRVEDNDLCIPEPSVSSHHCEVLLQGADVRIRDLGSTNGTFIGGEPIKESLLKAGQTLRLGGVELRLDNGAAAAAAKKPSQLTATPQRGVRMNELDPGEKKVDSPFGKKSNKANRAFLLAGIVSGLIVLALLVYAIFLLQQH